MSQSIASSVTISDLAEKYLKSREQGGWLWPSAARIPDASRLIQLEKAMTEHVLPTYLSRAVRALRSITQQCTSGEFLMMLDAVMHTSSIVFVQSRDWESSGKVTPGLVEAIQQFASWSSSCPVLCRPDSPSSLGVNLLTLLSKMIVTVSFVLTQASDELPLNEMIHTVLVAVCRLSSISSPVFNSTAINVPVSLTSLTLSMEMLRSKQLIQPMQSLVAATEVARLAVVSVATHPDCQVSARIFVLVKSLLQMEKKITNSQLLDRWPASMRLCSKVPLVPLVRALHTCAARYPNTSDACYKLLVLNHSQARMGPEQLVAVQVSLSICTRHAIPWMGCRVSAPDLQHSLRPEQLLLAALCRQITHIQESTPPERSLHDMGGWLCQPGPLMAHEAMLRGSNFSLDRMKIQVFLESAFKLVHWAVTQPHPRDPKQANDRMLTSFMRTLFKILLVLVLSEEHSTEVMRSVRWIVERIVLVTRGRISTSVEHYRVFVYAAMSVHTISWRIDPPPTRPPNRHADAIEFLGCVEVASSVYGRRLMQSCCNVDCRDLSGLLDSHLPTQLCSGCRRTRYCCDACQRKDWVKGAHRTVCGHGAWGV